MKVKLEEVCERDSSNLKQSDVLDKTGDYPIYGASGYIGNVDFYQQDKPYVAVVKDGAGIGRTMLLPAKSSVIGTMQYLLPKSNVLPKYLCYVVQYMHLEKYFSGATIPHIYFRDYKNEEFNLDSIERQAEIVDILSKVESVIFNRQQELQKLDELVKARFVEMFGDVKLNDKGWKTRSLKNLCDISRGGSPRPIVNYLGGTIPWIKIGDATDGDSIYINSTKEHIIEEGIKRSRYIKSGSLIFANCGVSLGFCRIITFDGCIHDGWLAFQNIDESLNKVFLLMTINQLTDYFRSIAPGGTQPNLNTEIMGNYQQILPPMEMQKEYIKFVEQVDKSKFVIQQALDKAQTLFDSLMQKYYG